MANRRRNDDSDEGYRAPVFQPVRPSGGGVTNWGVLGAPSRPIGRANSDQLIEPDVNDPRNSLTFTGPDGKLYMRLGSDQLAQHAQEFQGSVQSNPNDPLVRQYGPYMDLATYDKIKSPGESLSSFLPLLVGGIGAAGILSGLGGIGGIGSEGLIGNAGTDTLAGNSLSDFFGQLTQQGIIGPQGGLDALFTGLDAAGVNGLTGIGAQAAEAISRGGSALKSLSDALGIDEGTLRTLGTLAQTGLGIYSGVQQSNATNALGERILNMGAPSLSRYEASFAPGFDLWKLPAYKNALDAQWDSAFRGMNGNPFDNPGQIMEANKRITAGLTLPALQNYREMNRAAGFANVPQYAQIEQNAIGQQGGAWEAAGAGLESLLNPRQNYRLTLV